MVFSTNKEFYVRTHRCRANHASSPIFTVTNFSKRNPSWTESSLRWLIYCAKERHGAKSLTPANGLEVAIIRKQGRVFLDEEKFFDWLNSDAVERCAS